MLAKLLVVSGPDAGKVFEINAKVQTVFGRSREADVKLSDPRISPFHCRVEVRHSELFVVDLDSVAGIFVNNTLVREDTLTMGDTLTLGGTTLLVQDPDDIARPGKAAEAKPAAQPAAAKPATKRAAKPVPAPPPEPKEAKASSADLPERAEQLSGHVLANYKIGEMIARGRTGVVYKAHDLKHGRAVAVKAMAPAYGADERHKRDFAKAMKLVMPLRHENIVPVLGAGKTGPYCWVAMELVNGYSLTGTIRKVGVAGSLDWRRALRMSIYLSRGLNYLHEQKVVYRSIGPQNIMCDGEFFVPRLSDFLRARPFFDPFEVPDEMPDSLMLYMAPEQTREETEVDSRSDIFNLGSLLYQLLTGRPPFEGGSMAETITKIRREKPEDPRKFQLAIPQAFAGVVLQMLAKRPEERYQTMAEVLRELERALKYQGMTLQAG